MVSRFYRYVLFDAGYKTLCKDRQEKKCENLPCYHVSVEQEKLWKLGLSMTFLKYFIFRCTTG